MRHRKIRRFRHSSNNRGYHSRRNGGQQHRLGPNSFSNNGITRNNFSNQSAEKLVEKYNALAKEALSSGDKILSENYLQHADHFIRIIDYKNLGQNSNKVQDSNTIKTPTKNSLENNVTKQESDVEEKKE